MHVWQMNNGRWQISLPTNSPIARPVRGLAGDLFRNFTADTRAPAEAVAEMLVKGFGQ